MPFVDTNVLFSYFDKNEKNHFKARKIIRLIDDNSKHTYFYSDYVFDEILTLVRKRQGVNVSNRVLDVLIDSNLKLLKLNEAHLNVALEIFRKYGGLSFTDSTIVALMLDKEIKEIYSFDKGFDSIPKIIRLEEPL